MTLRISNGLLASRDWFRRRRSRRSCAKPSLPSAVGIELHIAVDGIVGDGAPREALARRDVGVFVMPHENVAGLVDVAGEVLGLAVEAHDAVVAADALIVLGRHAAGVVQRALAGEHHGGLGRHDEDAAGVHQHGGFGVPVGLRADVDAVDHQIDFAARLGELDQPRSTRAIQSMFSTPLSMEILAPAERVNHSSGMRFSWQDRSAARMRRHSGSAIAPRSLLGSPSSRTRVMPSGYFAGEVANHADDDVGLVLAVGGRSTGTRRSLGIEIVLDEFAGRKFGPRIVGAGVSILMIS